MKKLWLDVETTGLDPERHAIIQIGAIVQGEDGEVMDEFNCLVAPHAGAQIEPEALKVNGCMEEDLKHFTIPECIAQRFRVFLLKCGEKMYPAGHNVAFDRAFLMAFLGRFPSADDMEDAVTLIHHRSCCTLTLAMALAEAGAISVDGFGLGKLSAAFGTHPPTHDALDDARAAMSAWDHMIGLIRKKEA